MPQLGPSNTTRPLQSQEPQASQPTVTVWGSVVAPGGSEAKPEAGHCPTESPASVSTILWAQEACGVFSSLAQPKEFFPQHPGGSETDSWPRLAATQTQKPQAEGAEPGPAG